MSKVWLPRGDLPGPSDARHLTQTVGVDPRRGRSFFGVCRPSTVFGRHTIQAKLTFWTGGTSILDPKIEHVVWLEPSTFRMRRPR